MSLIEFIGFIITMLAMTLLFRKRVKEERRRRESPDDVEEEGLPPTDPLKALIKSLEFDSEEEEESLQPPPKKEKPLQTSFKPKLEGYRLNPKLAGYGKETAIEKRRFVSTLEDRYGSQEYEVHRRTTTSNAAKVVKRLHSRRDMMICHEILTRYWERNVR